MDIIDELFMVASADRVRAAVCDELRWREWFPGITLTSYDDRGLLGVRWQMTGELEGTAEVWLQEHGDGTIVHVYVRAEPPADDPTRLTRSRRRVVRRYVTPLKRHLVAVKDILEGGRPPGTARVPLGERVSSASPDGQESRRPRLRPPIGTNEGAARDGRPDHVEHRDHG